MLRLRKSSGCKGERELYIFLALEIVFVFMSSANCDRSLTWSPSLYTIYTAKGGIVRY